MSTIVHLAPAARLPWSLDAEPKTADGLKQAHMWNILRGPQARGSIDAAHLALLASTDSLPIDEREASVYLAALLDRSVVKPNASQTSFWLAHAYRREVVGPRLLQVQFLFVPGRRLGGGNIEATEAPL